jgi:hypothetical protein
VSSGLIQEENTAVSWTRRSSIGAAARSYRQRFGEEARGFDDFSRRRRRAMVGTRSRTRSRAMRGRTSDR